uniref:NADH-ubiquinone oxidoreductase chain 4 n=1 Tax=Scolytinae sp. BMNH 1274712 TaxID=1796543 RepID=A0A140EG37_9CUCU|nr:NADH dehydrogenase subunit 4 [Scolytinae sp. BMNH 1274712]
MNFYSSISYMFGNDLLSYSMILLSIWICVLMIMSSYKLYKEKFYSYMFLLIMWSLMISLYITFSSLNLFMFYIFFEMSIIPTVILILGWGYQPERLQAGIYLLFYTLLASMPMLVMIIYWYQINNSLHFWFLNEIEGSLYMYMLINSVFLVKFPMYFVHLWLPKAHLEAPVSGSMILAGIMLKLGGYGLIRCIPSFLMIGVKINYYFVGISLLGGVIVSLMCLRQVDMKSLIAYSSVAHMSMVLAGILSLYEWGLLGGLVMMIAHGLCSSGLFCLANMNYERILSRSLFINKGMINLIPSFSLWWFLMCSSSMAAPPSLNLLGEIMLINSLISFSSVNMLMIIFISFLGGAYSLYLYSYSQHGKVSSAYSFNLGSIREFLLLMMHWLPLNLLIMNTDLFM